METAKVSESVPLRIQCSECKRFYAALKNQDGEINGNCPHCHTRYHEHGNGTIRLIRIVRSKKQA